MPNPVIVRRLGGGAGMGLRFGLVSYWKLDELSTGSNRLDSFGSNDLTDVLADVPSSAGLINGGAGPFGQTAAGTGLRPVSSSSFQLGGSSSFTCAGWYFTPSAGTDRVALGKWTTAAAGEYILYTNLSGGSHYFEASFSEGGTTQKDIFPVGNSHFQNFSNVWQFRVVGYDGVNQLGFMKASDGAGGIDTQTVSCTGMVGTAQAFVLGNYTGLTLGWWGNIDEVGFWNRVLTDSELVMLYNNGLGLPFSSF